MENQYICPWAKSSQLMTSYHDEEWGVASYDDTYLFEMLNLEGAQAGLSWSTILNKREGYRQAFHHFEIDRCAALSDEELESILSTAEVVRNRLKVYAVRKNALAAMRVIEEYGSFSNYIWRFSDHKPVIHHWEEAGQVPAQNDLSAAISKDMKKRGFTVVGPVIIYSFLQAIGLYDDHLVTCPCHSGNRKPFV
ncbi:DNA-3-methyladenine glycosylase I [Virgibacillus senegalensis]|uniref:DNA-3-methyladenine glycosylase I n=1 Tax=Virgibacillus senegalensis TaxID=1499679 RepID=UPI000A8EC16D|nr:DNA-3-methyladenine glycosylase I [Virgibacillus senegalensis]